MKSSRPYRLYLSQARLLSPVAQLGAAQRGEAQGCYPRQLSDLEATSAPVQLPRIEKLKVVRGDRLDYQRTLVDLILSVLASEVYFINGTRLNTLLSSYHLSFSEEEVLDEGRNHNQLLHIVVKCGNYMIARVLIDNKSSLNVMPKTTLDKLHYPSTVLRNSQVVVRAFDGSKREVMGEITPPIRIGPTTFDITF
ncbi:hypothetical protein CR513_39407, partial [Mucuna pruriens]